MGPRLDDMKQGDERGVGRAVETAVVVVRGGLLSRSILLLPTGRTIAVGRGQDVIPLERFSVILMLLL